MSCRHVYRDGCSGMAPVAHAGGLGDVVFGLSRELAIRGHAVEIILPKYQRLRTDQIWGLTRAYQDLAVPWFSGAIHCSVWFGFVHGRKCFFIEPHSADYFFARNNIYGFADDALRFAFFSKAALEFMLKANKRPDVIHCHEWHTGLVPVLLFELYKFHGSRTVATTDPRFSRKAVLISAGSGARRRLPFARARARHRCRADGGKSSPCDKNAHVWRCYF